MKREDIARVIGHAEMAGAGFYIPLLRRVMQGEISVCWPQRATVQPPFYRLSKLGRPLVVIVGDDDYATTGPGGWACADKLRTWATFAVVHGAGGKPEHYEMAAEMAVQVRRLLLIETSSEAAQDWAAYLFERSPKLPFMGVLPPDGPHPVMPDKGQVH